MRRKASGSAPCWYTREVSTRSALLVMGLLGVSCGGSPSPRAPIGDRTAAAGLTLLDALERNDVAAVRASLTAPFAFGGMWFTEPACRSRFPVARLIAAPELPELARCIASEPLRLSARRDRLAGVALLEHGSGFELAIRFSFFRDRATVRWLGYSGHRDPGDVLPTLTASAFLALRTDTKPLPALPADSGAWLKLCLTADGTLSSVNPLVASSPEVYRALDAHVRTWTFRAFVVANQAVPACGILRLSDVAPDVEVLPLPVPASARGLRVSQETLKRVAGEIRIVPDDEDKLGIHKAGIQMVSGSFWYCVDDSGGVTEVTPIDSTGVRGYEAKLIAAIRRWRFQPLLVEGKPVPACATVTFVYNQG